MSNIVKITDILSLTHDVKRFTLEKPKGYTFEPGQATEVAINRGKWKEEKRPFTFTSLPHEDHLEFVIKLYHNHDGVTHQLDHLNIGDELTIGDAWGAITYRGKGAFIAGGAGITPFIAILRDLEQKGELDGHQLFFSNKTGKDVIMESALQDALGEQFISTLTHENIEGHEHGRINMEFLKKHVQGFSQQFYVCGPDQMVKDISQSLEQLGANPNGIVFEK